MGKEEPRTRKVAGTKETERRKLNFNLIVSGRTRVVELLNDIKNVSLSFPPRKDVS